jgi:hypothetical protein
MARTKRAGVRFPDAVVESANKPVRVLNTWREIAAHLGVTSRTAQKWERECALPVHRTLRKERARVWALAGELDEWRRVRGGLGKQPAALPWRRWLASIFRPLAVGAAGFAGWWMGRGGAPG